LGSPIAMDGIITFWLLAALMVPIGLLTFTYLLPVVIKRLQKRDMAVRCNGRLAVTYDDGPDPKLTPELIELLKRHGVKASFFLVGFRAERSPAMSDLLRDSDHDIGCHTNMHRNAWRIWPWQGMRDVNDGYTRMARWMQADASFRPPFGKMTAWTWMAAARRGARICWWTCDGGDTHESLPDPSSVVREVADAGGGVVLMHSHDRGQDRHEYVLKLTDLLLTEAKRQGWTVCTMAELLGASPSVGVPSASKGVMDARKV